MDFEAVGKAWRRFHRAHFAYGHVFAILNYSGFETFWSQFLIAGDGIHRALEKGAKDSPQSRQWFGAKKRERRLDPLLNYMHQARNAEEHGIEETWEPGDDPRGQGTFLQGFSYGDTFRTREGIFGFFSTASRCCTIYQITPPSAKLMPVYNDKWKQLFDPPTEHLGRPLKSTTPLGVGLIWLVYLRRLVLEAEALTFKDNPELLRSISMARKTSKATSSND